MSKLFSEDFNLKDSYRVGDCLIRKFREEDNQTDYEAVMRSVDIINKVRGKNSCYGYGNFPPPGFSPEDNLKDVKGFIKSFEGKESIEMIIWDKNGKKYMGCLYLYPIEMNFPELKDEFDLDFSMWVTKEAYEDGKYDEIYIEIWNWIVNTLPFIEEKVYHRNVEKPIHIK